MKSPSAAERKKQESKTQLKLVTGPAPWKAPISLEMDIAGAPAFPLEVLPSKLGAFVRSIAEAIGPNCPPDYAGCLALPLFGSALGRRTAVEVKTGWLRFAALYLCVVARKGSAKSPSLDLLDPPFNKLNESRHKAGVPGLPIVWANNATKEGLQKALVERPELAIKKDEIAGYFGEMGAYKNAGPGGAGERQFLLEAWGHSCGAELRRGRASAIAKGPALTILGGIQPTILENLRRGNVIDDGLFERFLFCCPARSRSNPVTRAVPSLELSAVWEKVITEAFAEERVEPRIISLYDSPAAWRLYEDFSQFAADVRDRPENEWFEGSVQKMTDNVARLALISHCLQEAYGRKRTDKLNAEDMQRAILLAKYFLEHCKALSHAMGRRPDIKHARRVLEWIERTLKSERNDQKKTVLFKRDDTYAFTERECKRANSSIAEQEIVSGLMALARHGHVRAEKADYKGTGRTGSDIYVINPHVSKEAAQN